MESRAMRISRLAARIINLDGSRRARDGAQFTRMKALFPQKKLSAEEARNLQLIYFKKRDKTPKGRMEGFTEMTEAMEALVETHPVLRAAIERSGAEKELTLPLRRSGRRRSCWRWRRRIRRCGWPGGACGPSAILSCIWAR
jgi:hypothetical protein